MVEPRASARRVWPRVGVVTVVAALLAALSLTSASAPLAGASAAGPSSVARNAPAWAQQEVIAFHPHSGDLFGYAVAASGTTALVGAPSRSVNGHDLAGAVFAYAHTASGWVRDGQLTAGDAAYGEAFGSAVAISGNVAVIGAPEYSIDGNTAGGAAYVFTRTNSRWSQQAELIGADTAANDLFGISVAISGSTVIVGAPQHSVGSVSEAGAAYVFSSSKSVWSQRAELTAFRGRTDDSFGISVATSGKVAIVGAPSRVVDGDDNAGAAFVFSAGPAGWRQAAVLAAASPATNDSFGSPIAMSGLTAMIAVPGRHPAGVIDVFVDTNGTWVRQAELTAQNPSGTVSGIGTSIAISGDTAIFGEPISFANDGRQPGSAVIFTHEPAGWTRTSELQAADGYMYDEFGDAVAVSGSTAVVGAPDRTVHYMDRAGDVYIFTQ